MLTKRKTPNGIDTLTAFGVLNCVGCFCDILSNESECSPTLLLYWDTSDYALLALTWALRDGVKMAVDKQRMIRSPIAFQFGHNILNVPANLTFKPISH